MRPSNTVDPEEARCTAAEVDPMPEIVSTASRTDSPTSDMSDDNGKVLLGKRCVVTGGGSGIGRSIALCLAGAGARVAITGRREERLQETAALSVDVLAQTMDVTDRDAVDVGFERIREELGGLDVLVNNAGVGGPNACGVDGPDRWDEIVRTNLDGLFFCTRAALRYMADGGRIIFNSDRTTPDPAAPWVVSHVAPPSSER